MNTRKPVQTSVIKGFKLKNGTEIPEGTECVVHPHTTSDRYISVVAYLDDGPQDVRFPAYAAGFYFDGFVPVTNNVIEQACMDVTCQSLLGEEVEPDGHDSHGFPSILLAAGIV